MQQSSFHRPFWLLVSTLLVSVMVYGQDAKQRIDLKGTLINQADSLPVPFVNMYNLRTHLGTSSAIDGSFFITAQEGDTVKLTSIGFEDRYLQVSASIQKDGLKIYLKAVSYLLNGVTYRLFDRDRFKDDFLNHPTDTSGVKLRLPKVEKVRGPVAGSQAAGTLFTFDKDRTQKDIARQNAIISNWQKQDGFTKKYNRELIKRVTNVPDEMVEDFVKFCDLKADFLEAATDYDLLVAIKQCYKAFLVKHPELKK